MSNNTNWQTINTEIGDLEVAATGAFIEGTEGKSQLVIVRTPFADGRPMPVINRKIPYQCAVELTREGALASAMVTRLDGRATSDVAKGKIVDVAKLAADAYLSTQDPTVFDRALRDALANDLDDLNAQIGEMEEKRETLESQLSDLDEKLGQ